MNGRNKGILIRVAALRQRNLSQPWALPRSEELEGWLEQGPREDTASLGLESQFWLVSGLAASVNLFTSQIPGFLIGNAVENGGHRTGLLGNTRRCLTKVTFLLPSPCTEKPRNPRPWTDSVLTPWGRSCRTGGAHSLLRTCLVGASLNLSQLVSL